MINSGGGGQVNDQMQFVNTKLPNENIQTYQPQMIDLGGVNDQTQIVNTKLPNENIQPTNHKWSIPREGGKLPNANYDQTTKWYHQSGSEWLRAANFAQFTTFPIFSHWSGSEWLGAANFSQFTTFSIFSHQMINSGEGGKWPNANCEHQTTKWKYPNLPTTNDRLWRGGGR